jgi:uncharacterized membrane protein (DUF373 family)
MRTSYRRFERAAAYVITLTVAGVIVVALYRLVVEVAVGLVFGALNPLQHTVFQTVFGQLMTVLIALEFNHTIQYVAIPEQGVIQTKTVLLISLLALTRKIVILDLGQITATGLLGLAGLTLALGITYWLMLERDDRHSAHSDAETGRAVA